MFWFFRSDASPVASTPSRRSQAIAKATEQTRNLALPRPGMGAARSSRWARRKGRVRLESITTVRMARSALGGVRPASFAHDPRSTGRDDVEASGPHHGRTFRAHRALRGAAGWGFGGEAREGPRGRKPRFGAPRG